jgi:predicted FMN-binding regulatory protein PaiB
MYPPEIFAPRSEADVLKLVTDHPLAWVVGAGGFPTPLPMRPKLDEQGRLVGLIGHFARRNPQADALRAAGRASFLFMGANGYVSPSWVGDRTWGPSWNYASAAFDCDLEFFDDAESLDALLKDLVGAMEAGRDGAWSVEEMGPRYDRLLGGIVGFNAAIRARQTVFKLGQDERDLVFGELLTGLRADGNASLADAMEDIAAR